MPEPTLVDLDRNTALETARRERVSEVLYRITGNAGLLNVGIVARVGEVRLVRLALYPSKEFFNFREQRDIAVGVERLGAADMQQVVFEIDVGRRNGQRLTRPAPGEQIEAEEFFEFVTAYAFEIVGLLTDGERLTDRPNVLDRFDAVHGVTANVLELRSLAERVRPGVVGVLAHTDGLDLAERAL